jgi:hypothetical protein
MQCPVCSLRLTYDVVKLLNKACASCQRHIRQMLAGFHGVIAEPRKEKLLWDNTDAFEDWKAHLADNDTAVVHLRKKDEYNTQRCDLRDMRKTVGLPKFLPLEEQVFTAWITEGVKDEDIQEVLGLTYSQLFAVKNVVKKRLQKQMAYFHQIQKLEKEGKV